MGTRFAMRRFSGQLLHRQLSRRACGRREVATAAAPYEAHPSSPLQPYTPPRWADGLKCKPLSFVQLAMRPTPIHRWALPGVPSGFQVHVKRDDLTGSTLSGNKVRKLEFLLADALQRGCDSVVTCGSAQSNHARATAIAARQLGLNPHLMLRCHGELNPSNFGFLGNMLLDRMVGARVIMVPKLSYGGANGLRQKMEEYLAKLKAEHGSSAYLIPVGGSDEVGVWGYIEAFREMEAQGVLDNYDDIVLATGSGGSACGVTIGNYLTGSRLRVHAVCVCDKADYFYQHVDEQLHCLGLAGEAGGETLRARDMVDFIEGYQGRGYGRSTEDELAQLVDIVSSTGLSLDPVYTLKGVRGLLAEMGKNPGRFAGKRVLYIHTGGVFGLFDGTVDSVLESTPTTSNVHVYTDVL